MACGRGELDPGLQGLAVYMPSSRRGGLLLFSGARRINAGKSLLDSIFGGLSKGGHPGGRGGGCMRTKVTDVSACLPLGSAVGSVGPVL